MSLKERIQTDLTAAMRSGDVLRRDVLRLLQNSLYNAEKAKQSPLADDEVEAVLAREITQRRESVDAFRKGGREDLVAKETSELELLVEYMPQLSESEVVRLIDDAVAETGATSPREMRAVMDWLRPRTAGRADAKRVGELTAKRLARPNAAAHDATAR